MKKRPGLGTILLGAGALLGLFFASVSTYDFVMQLDRQVHDVHCSFVPGASVKAESGCQVTMISSYSSVFRDSVWGGVPISLAAMAVFAFLLAFAVELVVTDRQRDVRATGFAALATGVPAITSMVMAYISLVKLDAVCKMCIGIYTSSAVCLAGGVVLFAKAWKHRDEDVTEAPVLLTKRKPAEDNNHDEPAFVSGKGGDEADEREDEPKVERAPTPAPTTSRPAPVSWAYLAAAFGVGVLFVTVPMVGYVSAAPQHKRFMGKCGGLAKMPDDDITLELDHNTTEPPTLEVLDPLCPACRGFEGRLRATGLPAKMRRRAVLFPLDTECNWMIDKSLHPGACTVSRAMLCAKDRAADVLAWSFAHQPQILKRAKADPKAAHDMVVQQFPDLAKCIDATTTQKQLNRSLRWAVTNKLRIMTPQLYVGNVKLCEEDVDLGLEYMLSRMLSAQKEGKLNAESIPEPTPMLEPDPRPASTRKPAVSNPVRPKAKAGAKPDSDTDSDADTDADSATDSAKKPAAKPAGKPTAKPADKPTAKPADKPAAKPADKPAAKPADKPAAKPATPPKSPAAAPKPAAKTPAPAKKETP